ncbi:DUF4190 domain-containing protein [Nocardioides sp. T2.26MG-1]|uniref:DUF4190 domain-containing protein n=1 Tax=Nocardioides sp. T2.26MG-1 TaxID=3041166 RepID=UPI00247737E8|nr:DUF4190 domain-containing protein [Nocardioides sp. T2.26MG-1]CAI9399700.1 hypothetical protein HIDPHFAB_00250 [Nocardioides sp. T2.26MG-1]
MSGSDPGQDPQAPPPYGAQPPYGQPQQPYQTPYQQPYPQPGPAQPSYNWAPKPPEHPSATTAMVLGLIGLVGILVCGGLTLVISPFAWVIGGRALREIDANPAAYSGREMASAGRVMGIVGTGLLALGLVVALAILVLILGVATTTP